MSFYTSICIYIVVSELFSVGEMYVDGIIEAASPHKNEIREKWYLKLKEGKVTMKSKFTESVLQFIDYRRSIKSSM